MDLATLAGRVAGAITLAGFIPYLISIWRGTTRPSRATWWIWTAMGAALCASAFAAGAGESIWVPVSYVVGPLAVAVVSIRRGLGGWSRLDQMCLAGAAIMLGVWATTGSPTLALGVGILVDACGAVPTLVKTWRDPGSEHLPAWALFLAGATLNLVAIPAWTPGKAGFQVYLTVLAATLVLLILRGRTPRLGVAGRSAP